MPRDTISEFTDAFIGTMLQDLEQTENEERFLEGLDEIEISRDDLDPGALEKIVRSCREFYIANETHIHAKDACLREGTYSDGFYNPVPFAGSDFYMSWVGHGVGFWDTTCWKAEHGQPMYDYAKGMGYFKLYLGFDWKTCFLVLI